MTISFKGRAKRLDDIDLPRIGHRIGVGEDEIHAFMDVEAAGSGFDAQGRIKMLFEPHIFWKELGEGKKRELAAAKGLAYPKWKAGAYPSDSYPRLLAAMEIDQTAALRSASWGLGQIMGFNHVAAGYKTVEAMIADFVDDEENHLDAMVDFLIAKKLDDDLRAHRWNVIEEVYNGGGHNGAYAVKMKNAFARWSKIRDTPWTPGAVEPDPVPPPPDIEPPVTAPGKVDAAGRGIAAIVLGAVMAIIAAVATFIGFGK